MRQQTAFAPAKVNLSLHVTGQRADGYHLLDSLVMFADFGDVVTVSPASNMSLQVSGPFAAGVPEDDSNLCWSAADMFGRPVAITLDKHLPAAAGIGGGSSDAAAVLRAMRALYDTQPDLDLARLGADVPVCAMARAARMSGIGDIVEPVAFPPLYAVLVNPRVEVHTPAVFKYLTRRDNPGMAGIPSFLSAGQAIKWLKAQRNDLEQPAIALRPIIGDVLKTLSAINGVSLVRMSGSGATCLALFEAKGLNKIVAKNLQQAHPEWWVQDCILT